ncbi:5'-phosphate synthase pdxT subunit [Apibacter mensalis]|uniref:Pyridoxal 5'-phosphate synthase subunit PdxT n=2 Tax=Apibacter mensalis TaxID=1586267 RepID=A0A0X3AMH8_9FLAO|nr:5'-phosphate synthase pdxT subunit [Apibacter mensalis]
MTFFSKYMSIKIGVLAVQGAFIEHIRKVQELGVEAFEIRQKKDFNQSMNGLIIPGGESTAIGKLLRDLNMLDKIRNEIQEGLPVFGTCAGLILLAKKVEEGMVHLGVMDITAKRNAYGRQLGSFYIEENFEGVGIIPMTFIRAPYITQVGDKVKILSVVNGHIVAAQEKNRLVTSFHPELTESTKVHQYFIEKLCI